MTSSRKTQRITYSTATPAPVFPHRASNRHYTVGHKSAIEPRYRQHIPPAALHTCLQFPLAHNNSGHCWRPSCRCTNNVQTRSNGIEAYLVNPCSRWAGGPCPCPCRCQRSQQRLPQRESRPKRRVLFSLEFPCLFTPRDAHFVPRCNVGRPLKPMVHRLRRQWGTSKGTVSLGTQLRGVPSKTC
jgi:hypothetical protein